MLLFCAPTELVALTQTEYIVCGGTFEMASNTAYQLYTLHGFVNGEAMALAWALLPNKTQATYVELLTALRSAMIAAYGDIGARKTFLIDFETAAINALRQVFFLSALLKFVRSTFSRLCTDMYSLRVSPNSMRNLSQTYADGSGESCHYRLCQPLPFLTSGIGYAIHQPVTQPLTAKLKHSQRT